MRLGITAAFRRVTEITPDILKKLGIRGLILDLDNTLTTHDNPVPGEGVLDWLDVMKKNNIRLMIVSNNHAPRVKPFADMLGLEFVSEGKKPLTKGFKEAVEKMGIPKKHIAAVGDQIFTDVLGAGLFGVKMLYVDPIEHEKTTFFKVKRKCEKPFLPRKYYNEQEKKQ
ncbi:MAG: YqeG family HAD IIIA-type phosphatase [Ruminococcus sp.]|nr:YqeG family HAD IIIA-type phosphatase [Ruminococcus sp.]MBR6623457.1 YqeG family HAD IIIA-type phosphatase [Ruminococcus sp.]